eukprot:TRINITY_DN8771_c0_g1_i1.p5 TRINITY_DN8771_c0_g1~~TRINITY_DN8771_c0_g1_i1.p5  ORF type:complete len:163 (-),score=21.53 TRINITY_DN8771_c0_g1_i1:320-808(-)
MLISKYPQYSLPSYPNVWTVVLILTLLTIPAAIISIQSHNLKPLVASASSIPLVLLIRLVLGIVLGYKHDNSWMVTEEKFVPYGVFKFMVVAESTVVRCLTELGQTYGVVSRGEWMNVFRRFDFALKLSEENTEMDRYRTGLLFWSWAVVVGGWWYFISDFQ